MFPLSLSQDFVMNRPINTLYMQTTGISWITFKDLTV